MSVASDNDMARFEDQLSDVMHQIEGISHFIINHFYTFSYLTSYVTLEKPSYT